MTRKEEIHEEAKSYAFNNPAIGLENDGGIYDDYYKTYQDFKAGVEYADESMIEKACEWLNGCTVLEDTTIQRFKKAMMEE